MNNYYTGVGSRDTPLHILNEMTIISQILEKKGYILRTGDAKGADEYFRKTVKNKRIYTVKDSDTQCLEMAKSIHPAWDNCSNFAKQLHARNCKQVLGDNLSEPSNFLICWTKNGKPIGGTRTSMILAQQNDIPIYNLAIKNDRKKLKELLKTI